MDISENSKQIGEKLFVLLDDTQRKELTNYVLERKNQSSLSVHFKSAVQKSTQRQAVATSPLTEIQVGDLYFCLEERVVLVRGRNVGLTHREFDAFHILIANRRRVMKFEMISYHVWGYDDEYVLPKTIHNIMSRVKRKLKVEPDVPDYISSVRGGI